MCGACFKIHKIHKNTVPLRILKLEKGTILLTRIHWAFPEKIRTPAVEDITFE